jgi:uncharacterized membrane protein HdeD (DUF308 family)
MVQIRELPMVAQSSPLPVHNWGWFMVRGIIALLLGVCAVVFPLSALFAFTLIFAAYAFVDGIASLIAGIRGAQAGQHWGVLIFSGIVGILVGILFLAMPIVATVTYAYLSIAILAAWSIITGVLEIWAAIRLRREIEGEWLLGVSGAISLLLGLAILVLVMPFPASTILSAAWLIAIYAFVAGVALVMQAFRLKRMKAA